MSEDESAGKTPEQMLSEALRAKAVQAPSTPTMPAFELFADPDGSFELLSGNDYDLPKQPVNRAEPAKRGEPRPLPAGWVLLLALALGAAAGAVAGLLTLR
jgi:hypothetical protein